LSAACRKRQQIC